MNRSKWAAVRVAGMVVMVVALVYVIRIPRLQAAKVIRAGRLELVDSSGKVTAILAASPDGLAICDPKGKTRAIVGMPLDGVPALGLLDETGQSRISLNMSSDGSSEISMGSKKTGKAVLHLLVSSNGVPGVYLDGSNGRGVVSMHSSDNDSGRLAIYDKESKVIWEAPPKK